MNINRILDANINRASEGLRVLEEISRFLYENPNLTEEIKTVRHNIRKTFRGKSLILSRNALEDIGYKNSIKSELDKKDTLIQLIEANFKRVQEALRVIEENLKILGEPALSKKYESFRFNIYDIEKYFYKPFFPKTDIYGITNESYGKSHVEIAKELIQAGIKIIQYREKDKSKNEKYNQCLEIRKITSKKNVFFIVNDDIDIAIAVKADGIHIGQNDLPVEQVKKITSSLIVGVSTHNKNQAEEAILKKADYIGVGPIFNTATKKNIEKSDGLNYLNWVTKNTSIPHVCIGGINESNILEVKNSGGKCFAMISEIAKSENINEKVNKIRKKLKGEN
jgi:thiamine-phosphate pyrophosphorylase